MNGPRSGGADMCKKIEELVELSKVLTLDKEQRSLVIEACLGYYILNEPPDELVRVVRLVSDRFIAYIRRKVVDATSVSKYIAATDGAYYGVLQQEPSRDPDTARGQLLAALESSDIAI